MTGPSRAARPDRLRLGLDPVRLLFSASPWRSAAFLLSYLLVSGVLFALALTASVIAVTLAFTMAALPLLIGVAWLIRGCADAERLRLRQVLTGPVRGAYPRPQDAGLWRRAGQLWSAGATWRDLGYVVGLWAPLLALDAGVFAVWAVLLAGTTVPVWYQHVSDVCVGSCTALRVPGVLIGDFPHGPHGAGAHGLYIDSLPSAALLAVGFAIAFLLFNYVLVAAARLHGRIGLAVLGEPADPLGPAREVLARPGPLGPLTTADH
jgi:hypothetical protein